LNLLAPPRRKDHTPGTKFMNHSQDTTHPQEPDTWVSVLICSHNTHGIYIRDCLDSIGRQVGGLGVELVWINDGSDQNSTLLLESQLQEFIQSAHSTRLVYHRNPLNIGLGATLNLGVSLCTCELILRMDSDDIMTPNRIQMQVEFMRKNPDCVMSGANLLMFRTVLAPDGKSTKPELIQQTNHPQEITIDWVRATRSEWFMNHPTLIYRKSAVLSVGNYNPDLRYSEDYDLQLKVLKKYGRLRNMPDVLLYYRMHEGQVTYGGKSSTPANKLARYRMQETLFSP